MVEAARERRSHLAAAPDPEPLFRTLFRLRHDLVMLRRAVGETAGEELEHLAQPWAHATQAGAAALRDIAEALRTRRAPSGSGGALAEAVGAYWQAIDETRQQELIRCLGTDAVGRTFGVAFALDQFRRDLNDLIERTRDRCGHVETEEG